MSSGKNKKPGTRMSAVTRTPAANALAIDPLTQVRFKAVIDALNFRAAKAPYIPKRTFINASRRRGFALQDPTKAEILALSRFPLTYLEVAVDAWPDPALAYRC